MGEQKSSHDILNAITARQEQIADLHKQIVILQDELHTAQQAERPGGVEDEAAEEMAYLNALHLRELVDTAAIGILVVNQPGKIVFVNDVASGLFHYDRSDVIGSPLSALIPERLRQRHERHFGDFMASPYPRPMGIGMDLVALRSDGVEIPVEISLNTLHSQQGILTVCFIVESPKHQHEQLNFRTLVDTAALGIIVVEPEGDIVIANPVMAELFGYDQQELFGMPVSRLIPEPYRERHQEHLEGYFADPKPRPMGLGVDLVAVKQDGTEFPVEISLSAIQSEDTTLSVAFIADITKRKQAEEHFKILIDTAAVGIIVVRRDGTIMLANQHAVDYFQYSKDDLEGLALDQLIPDVVRVKHRQHVETYFADPHPRPMGMGLDLVAQRRDGTRFPVEISLSTVRTDSDLLGVAFIADVSDRLHGSQLRAEIAGKLIADVSHDLKTPMTTIIARLHLLQRDLQGQSGDHIEMIGKHVHRLNQLIESMSEMARLDAVEQIELEPSDLKRLLVQIADQKQIEAGQKDIVFTLDVDESLPDIPLNKALFSKALEHILNNALTYTTPGRSVTLTADQDGDYVRVAVSDTGIGMTQEQIPLIFDRFYRIEESRPMKDGLGGLGLSLVKRVIDLHQGSIEVTSEPEKGSSFIVFLRKG